jgi:hypothetical protein
MLGFWNQACCRYDVLVRTNKRHGLATNVGNVNFGLGIVLLIIPAYRQQNAISISPMQLLLCWPAPKPLVTDFGHLPSPVILYLVGTRVLQSGRIPEAILSYPTSTDQKSSPPERVAEIRPSPNSRDVTSCLDADLAATTVVLLRKGTVALLPLLLACCFGSWSSPCQVQTRESLSKLV